MSNVTVTQTGGAANAAVTVSRGLQGAAGPNSVTTSTSSNLTGFISANGTAVSGATAGTTAATPNTLVLRDGFGGGVSFTSSDTNSTTVAITNTGTGDNSNPVALSVEATGNGGGVGANISSNNNTALIVSSTTGTGASINSISGQHLNVGNSKLVVANNGNTTFTGALSFTSTTRPTSGGTGTPAATSLITLTDIIGQGGRRLSAQLVADETGDDNTVTLKTSATLTLALEVGLYHVEALIIVSGGTLFATVGTRQKLAFTGTGTFSGTQTYSAQNGAATSSTYPTTRAANAVDAENLFSANSSATLRHGTLNVTVAGNLVVQWAQRTAGVGSAPTLNPPSYIRAQRIS